MTVPVEVVAVPVVVVAVVVVLCFLGLAQALPYANVNGFQPANCAKWQEILVHVFNISKDCRRSSSPRLGLVCSPEKGLSAMMIKLLTNLCADNDDDDAGRS